MGKQVVTIAAVFALVGFVCQVWNLTGTAMGKSVSAHKNMGFALSKTEGKHDYTLDYSVTISGTTVAGALVAASQTLQKTWYGVSGVITSADVAITFPFDDTWGLAYQLLKGNAATGCMASAPIVSLTATATTAGTAAVVAGTACATAQATSDPDTATLCADAATAKTAADTAVAAITTAVTACIGQVPEFVGAVAAETAYRTAIAQVGPLATDAATANTALAGARSTLVTVMLGIIAADEAGGKLLVSYLPAGYKLAASADGGDVVMTLPDEVAEKYKKHADNNSGSDWKKCADAAGMLATFAYVGTILFLASTFLAATQKQSASVRGGLIAFTGLWALLNLYYFNSTCGAQAVPDYVKDIQKSEWGNFVWAMLLCGWHCLWLGVADLATGNAGTEAGNMAMVVNEDLYNQ